MQLSSIFSLVYRGPFDSGAFFASFSCKMDFLIPVSEFRDDPTSNSVEPFDGRPCSQIEFRPFAVLS